MKPKRSKASDPDKFAFWSKQCSDWQSSGLSQRAFCQREELSYSCFDYWRRRVAPAVASTKPAQPKKLTLVAAIPAPDTDTHSSSAILPATNIIHLRSPGGWHIELPSHLDNTAMTYLAQLLAQLP